MQNIILALKLGVSGNNSEIKESEKFIEETKSKPLYLTTLLKIICCQDSAVTVPIKLNAAVQFKNLVENCWKFTTDQKTNESLLIYSEEKIIIISDQEKQDIMSQIIEIIGDCTDKAIMKLLTEAIRKIFKFNYSKGFKEPSITSIKNLINSQNESKIYSGLSVFYQLSKLYEHETSKNRKEYYDGFTAIFESLTSFLIGLKQKLDNEVGLVILKKLLKIFYRSINTNIPPIMINQKVLAVWIGSLIEIITSLKAENKKNELDSNDDPINTNYWKVGLSCFQILFRIIQKYGNPNSSDSIELKEFSLMIKNNYDLAILKAFFLILENSKIQNYPSKIIATIFRYLTHCISYKMYMEYIYEYLDLILNNFVVQNTILNKQDIELREEDEKGYIYKLFDMASSLHDKRSSVCNFIRALCEYKVYDSVTKKLGPPELMFKCIDFLNNMFDQYEKSTSKNYLIKEALMQILQSISIPLQENKKSNEIETILSKYIIPELSNSSKNLLQERGVFVIKMYSTLNFNKENLVLIIQYLCNLLVHKELSLRVVTSVTLPCLMKNKEVTVMLEAYIKNLLEEYIKLMHQIDLEELLVGLKNIIDHFGEKTIEFAIDLTKELINQFNRLIVKNDENLETQLAAEGVIKAVGQIVSVVNGVKSDKLFQIEALIEPLLVYTLKGDGFEFLDDGLEIIKELTKNTISPMSWKYFTLICFSLIGEDEENQIILKDYPDTALQGIGYDSAEEHMSVLASYVKDFNGLLCCDTKGVKYIERLFSTIHQVLKNEKDEIDVTNNVICCRMFIQLIDSSTYNKVDMDFYFDKILGFVVGTIYKTKQLTFKLALYSVLSSLVINNGEKLVEILHKDGSLDQIKNKWFTFINSVTSENDINKNLLGLIQFSLATKKVFEIYSGNLIAYSEFVKSIYVNICRLNKIIENKKKDVEEEDYDENETSFDRKLRKVKILI